MNIKNFLENILVINKYKNGYEVITDGVTLVLINPETNIRCFKISVLTCKPRKAEEVTQDINNLIRQITLKLVFEPRLIDELYCTTQIKTKKRKDGLYLYYVYK